MNKIEMHQRICDQLHGLYAAKNLDYGDSFAEVRSKYPTAILIRLTDKLNRLATLMHSDKPAQVRDESIDDTLADLANYAIMELVERRMEEDYWARINHESVCEPSPRMLLPG